MIDLSRIVAKEGIGEGAIGKYIDACYRTVHL